MNVLILTGSYAPESGGIAVLMRGFAEGLLSQGVRPRILAATAGAQTGSSSRLPIREFRLPARGYRARLHACRQAVLADLASAPCDRLVTSSWSPYALSLLLRGRAPKLPWDTFCHGMDLLEPSRSLRYRLLMRYTLGRASRVLANSRFTADLARRSGAREHNLRILHPGVDSRRFTPGPKDAALLQGLGIPAQARVLLSVGRLIERKGFDTVLHSMDRSRTTHPGLHYLVVGEGPDRHRLEQLARQLGLQDSVHFAGNVRDDDLPAFYRAADLFVMPSRLLAEQGDVEGFGIVYLEAACCGLPSIAGRVGGAEDAVVEGITGFLIPPDDADLLVERLQLLMTKDELRRQMGEAARRRAEQDFAWPGLAARYLEWVS